MKEYIFLLYTPENPLPADQAQQLRQQWGKLVTQLRQEGIFVEGYIFSPAGYTVQGTPERDIQPHINISNGLQAGGCIVITATNMEEALLLAQQCPILNFGGAVEVRERVPQPQPQTQQLQTVAGATA